MRVGGDGRAALRPGGAAAAGAAASGEWGDAERSHEKLPCGGSRSFFAVPRILLGIWVGFMAKFVASEPTAGSAIKNTAHVF